MSDFVYDFPLIKTPGELVLNGTYLVVHPPSGEWRKAVYVGFSTPTSFCFMFAHDPSLIVTEQLANWRVRHAGSSKPASANFKESWP